MLRDKDGNLSSKRIAGVIVLLCAVVFTYMGKGEPELVQAMFYGGFISLGVTAFERKS